MCSGCEYNKDKAVRKRFSCHTNKVLYRLSASNSIQQQAHYTNLGGSNSPSTEPIRTQNFQVSILFIHQLVRLILQKRKSCPFSPTSPSNLCESLKNRPIEILKIPRFSHPAQKHVFSLNPGSDVNLVISPARKTGQEYSTEYLC